MPNRLHCPKCGATGSLEVINSRITILNEVRRRRHCSSCDHRYTTVEDQQMDSDEQYSAKAWTLLTSLIEELTRGRRGT